MTEKAGTGGGPAGGGGYGFHALAIAYVACHILAGEPLHWFSDPQDIPIAVRAETGGPGDDMLVELATKRSIEVQVKSGLSKGHELWTALKKLVDGLKADPQLLAVLLVDQTTSGTIRNKLPTGLERLRGGNIQDDENGIEADSIAAELLQLAAIDADRDRGVLQRLRVISVYLDPGQPNNAVALAHLRAVLAKDTDAEGAFERLTARALRLIKLRGRADVGVLQLGLGKRHQLATDGETPSAVRQRFLKWQVGRMATFGVPGFVRHVLQMGTDWVPRSVLPRIVSKDGVDERESSRDAEPAESVLSHLESVVRALIAGPGDGKSLTGRRIAYWLAIRNRMVIHVRLRQVARKVGAGSSFSEALRLTATDGIEISTAAWSSLISESCLLIADGIDECGTHASEMVEGLQAWHLGHSNIAVLVTTRPAGTDSVPAAWTRYDLQPWQEQEQDEFVRTLVRIAGGHDEIDKVLTAVKKALEDKRLASLRPASPLVLGFLTRLVLDGIEPGYRRSDLFGNLAKRLLNDDPHDARPEPELEASLRRFGYRAAGWHLLMHEPKDKEAMETMIAATVADSSGVERSRIASKCLSVLEARGLLEPMGDGWTFVHDALAEHAAGLWLVSDCDPAERRDWITANATNERFQSVFLFAAGADSNSDVFKSVIDAWDRNNAVSPVPLLAALMIAEMPKPDSSALQALIPELICRLQLPVVTLVGESTRALQALASRFPTEVASAVRPLLDNDNRETAWHAMAICVACGSAFVDQSRLKSVLRELQTAPDAEQQDDGTETKAPRIRPFWMMSTNWATRRDFVSQAIDLLLESDISDETVELMIRTAWHNVSASTFQQVIGRLGEKGLSAAAALIASRLAPVEEFRMLSSILRPREQDLELLLTLREACGHQTSDAEFRGAWDALSEFGKLLNQFTWGDQSFGDYAVQLNQAGLTTLVQAVSQASAADVPRLANELDWAIVAQRAALAQPDQRMSGSIYSSLNFKGPDLDWSKVHLSLSELPMVVEALGHPCIVVGVMAVKAINGGVVGERAGELCQAFIRRRGATAAMAAFIESSVVGYCPIKLLCDVMPARIPAESWPLFHAIEQLDNQYFDEKVLEVLVRGVSSTARVAASAARSLMKCDPSIVRPSALAFQEVFALWRKRDDTRPDRIIPHSPRPELVDLLWKLGAFDPSNLLDLTEDHRSDVKERAVRNLARHFDLQPEHLSDFLSKGRSRAGIGYLIAELGRSAPAALERVNSTLLSFTADAHPEVQATVLRLLPSMKPDRNSATVIIYNLCGSYDPVVRTAAVNAARNLRIPIPADLFGHTTSISPAKLNG
jgi:hypothetical protein